MTAGRGGCLRLCYVVAPGGGAYTYVRQIARTLAVAGHDVSVIQVRGTDFGEETESVEDGVRVHDIGLTRLHHYYSRGRGLLPARMARAAPDPQLIKSAERSLSVRGAIRRMQAKDGPFDLIEFPEEVMIPPFARGLPYAVKLHSSDATWRHFCGERLRPLDWSRIKLESRLLAGARLVSSPSSALADHVAVQYSYPRARIAVLPYPLDIQAFCPDAGRGESGAEGLSVLYVGRLARRKGLESLARSAARFLDLDGATLDIVGAQTEDVARDSFLPHIPGPLRDRVVFHGRVPYDRLPEYYRRASVCVVPSHWDNSPNTVYEAMGCGTPVVTTRVGGIPELVEDGKTGVLVPPSDPDSLGRTVRSLLTDPQRRVEMGRAARARALRLFDPEMIAGRTLDLYRSVAG